MANLKMIIPKEKPYRSYIPTELGEAGFVGEVEIFTSSFAAAIIKPGADDSAAIKSLSVILQDLGIRAGKKVRVTVGE